MELGWERETRARRSWPQNDLRANCVLLGSARQEETMRNAKETLLRDWVVDV